MDLDAIGARIISLRTKRKMSQQALCRELGVNSGTAGAWERGVSVPQTENLFKMSKLFGVSIDYILYGPDDTGGDVVISDGLAKFLESPDSARLSEQQRNGLVRLLSGTESNDWEIRAALKLLLPSKDDDGGNGHGKVTVLRGKR